MAAQPLAAMTLAAAGCWAAVGVLTGWEARGAVMLGAAGPLAFAVGSWLLIERTAGRRPERLPRVMIGLFGAKLVLVGGYVAAVLVSLSSGAAAFVVSFTAQYVVLHAIEALCLRRLLTRGAPAVGR
jgi:hypothetical protein